MAEAIPYGMVERVITRLGSLAFQEMAKIYEMNTEIQKLKHTIELVRAVLLDAEEKQEQNYAVKIWILRLKEVLHEADDLFDDLMVEEMRHNVDGQGNIVKKVCNIFSSSSQVVFRVKMSHKIKKIREQFTAIKEDVSNLNLISRSVMVTKHDEIDRRETSSMVLEANIIGRDESKREIINLLLTNNNQNVSSIAIVGIGGLGKTALAQLVYNDAEVKKFFHKQIWVCVSQDFEVKTIVKNILESATNHRIDDLQLEVLQHKLQQEINYQRYLLVLDDVWNENAEKWNCLLSFLRYGAQGSKVLVTTRSRTVARAMSASTSYDLKGLSKKDSWALLKNFSTRERKTVSQDLEPIGEKIAEKCGGVPLAIKSIGALLQSKTKESEWLDILGGEFWKLCKDDDSIMHVLKLSYNHLPIELRQCFAYCSLLPKGCKIYKDDLIQVWMAQGYLECSNERQQMEDKGEQYVQILMTRSFFQEAELNINGEIECFKVHDLMHDLAQLVAGPDCFLDCEGEALTRSPMHVSFVLNEIHLLDLLAVNKTRTLLWPGKQIGKADLSMVTSLKRLRVLNLSASSMVKLPKSIGKLKHLRYLNLSNCCQLTSLPKTVSKLVNLQTLKLNGCERLEFSTQVITNLVNLHHLKIDSCEAFRSMMPVGLGRLTLLQSLSTFIVGQDDGKRKSAKLNELKGLNNLRGKLCINNLNFVRDVEEEANDVDLKGKKLLWSLELNWESGEDNQNCESEKLLERLRPNHNLKELKLNNYPGVTVSGWLSLFTNLVHIRFYGCTSIQHLPPLECLPFLEYLQLYRLNALEYIHYQETTTFFPSLKDLKVFKCPNLRGWHRALGDVNNGTKPPFPCLSHLRIGDCPNLTCMPTFPYLVERLTLKSSSVKPLIDTICWVKTEPSSSMTPLSKLRYMEIVDTNIEELQHEWMKNLTSLVKLGIVEISSLKQMQHLPSATLQELIVSDVGNLSCQFLHSFSSLQIIKIYYCHDLKDFLEWICNLPSLQRLEIHSCPNLDSLPEGMHRLTNLDTLEISDCALFTESCKKETHVDWPNVAHIPNVIVKG